MKPYIILALILTASACGKKEAPQAAAPAPAPVQASTPTLTGTPEGYVNSLQRDAQRAMDVRDKANVHTGQANEEIQKTLEGQ